MMLMKTRRMRATAGVTAALLIGGTLVALPVLYGLFGFTPSRSVSHPPCDQLPDVATVEAALTSHPELVREITAQGRDVTVGVGHPCEERSDVALIEIRYSARKTGLKRIEGVLNTHQGFGVPLVVRKSE